MVEGMSAASDKASLARQGSLLLITSVSANSTSFNWQTAVECEDGQNRRGNNQHASSKDVK